MKRALWAAVIAAVFAASGCGSGSGSGTTDPATIAPPGTLAYLSFELEPDDDERAGFDAAFGKLLGSDPSARVGELFTRAVQTSGRLSYEEDMKPWLGKTATVVVTKVGRRSADFALLVAAKDGDKARDAIAKDLASERNDGREHRDVEYRVMADGTANGVVEDFLVAGTEPALKAVIDAAKDDQGLAGTDEWKRATGKRLAGTVGVAYIDAKGLLQSVAAQLPGAQSLLGPLLVGLVELKPFVATLQARADALVVDVSSPGTKPDPRGPRAASSELIERLPADAWFALALPRVGESLGMLVDALKANPLIGAQYRAFTERMRGSTGLDLEADVLASLGDVGAFARGTSGATADGGLVVESSDRVALGRTVRRLPALIARSRGGAYDVTTRPDGFDVRTRGMSRPLQVRVTGDRAVAGYGASATRAAVRPPARLGATPTFREASRAIGGRPTLFVDLQAAVTMAAASPHHSRDERFRRALPRLQRMSFAAVGARRDAGLDVVRAVVGLR